MEAASRRRGGGQVAASKSVRHLLTAFCSIPPREASPLTLTLPSEPALTNAHGVSRNPARRALKLLEAEGVVQSGPGIGWRIPCRGDRRSLAEPVPELIYEDSLSVSDSYPPKPSCVSGSLSRVPPSAASWPRRRATVCTRPFTGRGGLYALCQHLPVRS
ncbi:GntR family transcriptional regulator [Streptomyces sp. SAT1]|uniref:GntR family transcriptional regulator n=1 Tax=Streptomyces sp. SAT1 TaxID=1849967 RepID=UPI0030032FBC